MTYLAYHRVQFGPFKVDLTTRERWRNGIRLKLGGQPFQILIALLEQPGQLVTREVLRKRIWSEGTFVDFSHGLNAAVNKLREALCDSPDDPRYIETLPLRSYRFIAKVEEVVVQDESEAIPVGPAHVPCALPLSVDQQVVTPAAPPARKGILTNEDWQSTVMVSRQTFVQMMALVASVTVLAVGIAGFFWSRLSTSPSAQEGELQMKRNAESSSPEQLERRLTQKAEAANSRETINHQPKTPDTNSPIDQDALRRREESLRPAAESAAIPLNEETRQPTLKPSPSEGSVILRFERAGERLGHIATSERPAILSFDLHRPHKSNSVSRIISGWDAIGGPEPSPEGKKLAFTAGRTDSMEIWVCNFDGSSPKMLADLRSAGTPRWSPNSRWIAFDSDGRYGHSGIYIISADGGPVAAVVEDGANNSVPSWSRDGKYIYFASNRTNSWNGDQLWKVPASGGGQPIQITHYGGFSAFESTDGQTIYYAKTRYEHPEIWQVSVYGGPESRVPLLHPSTWASWAITDKGIFLLSEYSTEASQLQFLDFSTQSMRSLATLQKASFWLAASADGSAVWYSGLTDSQARQVFQARLQ